jgi:hypothetical protein
MHRSMVKKTDRPRIGDILKKEGLLSGPALERGLATQQRTGRQVRLGSVLVGLGIVSEEALLAALARAHGCTAVGSEELGSADPAAIKLLPSARAYRLEAIPFAFEKKTVRVAFLDPSNIAALDEVAAVTGRRVIPSITSELRLLQAHEKFYGRPLSRHHSNILKRLEAKPDDTVPIVRTPPPPPRFGEDYAAETETPYLAVEAAEATPPQSDPDPFSDAFSLTEFLAQALDGVSIDALWEAAGGDDEETLDPGEPISEDEPLASSESFETTRPSSRRSPETSADPNGLEFGALA